MNVLIAEDRVVSRRILQKRDGALMSHGMCPVCSAQVMKELNSGGNAEA